MGRRVKEQKLYHPDQQHHAHRLGRFALEERGEDFIGRAHMAQHGGGQPVGGGAIARFGGAGGGRVFERGVEHAAMDDHALDDIKGDVARGVGCDPAPTPVGTACAGAAARAATGGTGRGGRGRLHVILT